MLITSGKTKQNGFTVTINGITEASENYQKSLPPPESLKKHYLLLQFVYIVISTFVYIVDFCLVSALNSLFGNSCPLNAFDYVAITLSASLLVSCLIFRLFDSRYIQENRWHSCEHKVVNIFCSESSEFTLDSLQKAPSFTFRCGTNVVSSCIVFLLIIGPLCDYSSLLAYYFRTVQGFSALNAVLLSLFVILLICFSVIVVCLYPLQKILFLCEPTEKDYAEALRVALRLQKNLNARYQRVNKI
jgi:uncharacterized protein YqhQ